MSLYSLHVRGTAVGRGILYATGTGAPEAEPGGERRRILFWHATRKPDRANFWRILFYTARLEHTRELTARAHLIGSRVLVLALGRSSFTQIRHRTFVPSPTSRGLQYTCIG